MGFKKVGAKAATKAAEKRAYFSSDYGMAKICKFSVGARRYFVLLNPEQNFYTAMVHPVKAKEEGRVGFKGIYDTNIKCKGYDDDGNVIEGATCCAFTESEKQKYPEKEDSIKRLISWARPDFLVPAAALGTTITDPNTKAYPITNVEISNGYEFTFFEWGKSAWVKVYNGIAKKLKDDQIIDFDLEGEELQQAVFENLSKIIIQVDAVEPKSQGKRIKYEKEYTFIHFDTQSQERIEKDIQKIEAAIKKDPTSADKFKKRLAAAKHFQEEMLKIQNWETDPSMETFRNDATEFITLMEKSLDEFAKDWTDEELKKYFVEDEVRKSNIEEYHKAMAAQAKVEETEKVVVTQKATMPPAASSVIEQVGEIDDIDLAEEDFSFDDDEDFLGDDD